MVIIYENHGEYDDYTKNPLFVCKTVDDAQLFIDALQDKDPSLWKDVIDFFGGENYVPHDIDFGWEEVKLLEI